MVVSFGSAPAGIVRLIPVADTDPPPVPTVCVIGVEPEDVEVEEALGVGVVPTGVVVPGGADGSVSDEEHA